VPDRTEAVLKWVDALLTKALENPASLPAVAKKLREKKEIVKEAFEDAVRPEFKEYAELVEKLLAL